VRREVGRLLSAASAWKKLGVNRPGAAGVSLVAYETDNRNHERRQGAVAEKKRACSRSGFLGQFIPRAGHGTIVAPIKSGPEIGTGCEGHVGLFRQCPAGAAWWCGRLCVFLLISVYGQFRSKIGVEYPRRSKGVLGSYDAANRVLTIVQFTQPAGVTDYVNSQWKLQEQPYAGDIANSYTTTARPRPAQNRFGPFYEMESSSPAAALAPGKSLTHIHPHDSFERIGERARCRGPGDAGSFTGGNSTNALKR